MTPPEHREPTDDEIDTLVRDALGEIDEQRFNSIVAGVVRPVDSSQETPASPAPARTRRWAGSGSIGGQLLAAAAVLVVVAVGFGALASRNSNGGNATETAGPASTTTPAAGPGAPTATAPGPTAVDEVANCERNEPGRNFTCRVPAAAPGAPAVELFDDESLTDGLVVEPGRLACVEVADSDGLTVIGGECSGAGLSVTAPASGAYTIQYDVRSCEISNDGTADRQSCTAATSVVEGEIRVLVGV